jgi:hypothetical protein
MEKDFRDEDSRVEKLLAMLLVRTMADASQAEKVQTLTRAGLSNMEVAAVLGMKPTSVAQQLWRGKAKRGGSADRGKGAAPKRGRRRARG